LGIGQGRRKDIERGRHKGIGEVRELCFLFLMLLLLLLLLGVCGVSEGDVWMCDCGVIGVRCEEVKWPLK
jgi:hypothetical protein